MTPPPPVCEFPGNPLPIPLGKQPASLPGAQPGGGAPANQGVNNLMAALIAKGVRVIRVGKADEARSEFHVDRVVDQSPMEQERRRLQAEMEVHPHAPSPPTYGTNLVQGW